MAKKIKIHHLLNETLGRTVADWVNLALHTPKLPPVNLGKYVMHSGRILYFACEGNIFSSKFKGPSPGCEGTLLKVCQVVSEDIFPSSVLLQSPLRFSSFDACQNAFLLNLLCWQSYSGSFPQILLLQPNWQHETLFALSNILAAVKSWPHFKDFQGCSLKVGKHNYRFIRFLFDYN